MSVTKFRKNHEYEFLTGDEIETELRVIESSRTTKIECDRSIKYMNLFTSIIHIKTFTVDINKCTPDYVIYISERNKFIMDSYEDTLRKVLVALYKEEMCYYGGIGKYIVDLLPLKLLEPNHFENIPYRVYNRVVNLLSKRKRKIQGMKIGWNTDLDLLLYNYRKFMTTGEIDTYTSDLSKYYYQYIGGSIERA